MGDYLTSVPEMKSAPSEVLIATAQKISKILLERELNDPELDLGHVFRVLLSDGCFNNPSSISEPFIVSNTLIALPSMAPEKDARGQSKGTSVVPFVQIPGEQPYQGYREDTPTFVDSQYVNLRGGRSISIHSVVPGMIVSFHHFNGEGGRRTRERIDAIRVSYDSHGELLFEAMAEEDALFPIPKS